MKPMFNWELLSRLRLTKKSASIVSLSLSKAISVSKSGFDKLNLTIKLLFSQPLDGWLGIPKTTIVFCLLLAHAALSQKAIINQVEINDGKVVVHYDLEEARGNQLFRISLLSSYDNFVKPLNFVKGDVGVDVASGKDKKITWDITKELGSYKGNLTFEVRGRVYVPFVRLTQFEEGKVYKRGKGYPITWESGNKSGNVDIEIMNKNQESVVNDNNLPNTGQYQLYIPGGTKKGTYTLKFTNVNDRSDVMISPTFTIKPKVPFIYKAIGVGVIGVGIVWAINSSSGGGGGETQLKPFADFPKNPGDN